MLMWTWDYRGFLEHISIQKHGIFSKKWFFSMCDKSANINEKMLGKVVHNLFWPESIIFSVFRGPGPAPVLIFGPDPGGAKAPVSNFGPGPGGAMAPLFEII